MKHLIRLGLSVALPLTLLAGCKAAVAPMPDASMVEVAALGTSGAKVLSAIPKDGQANVRVNLNLKQSPLPGFKVMALPNAWTEALVSLHSPSVSGDFDRELHSRPIKFDALKVISGGSNIQLSPGSQEGEVGGADSTHLYVVDEPGKLFRVEANQSLTPIALNGDLVDRLFPGHGGNTYAVSGAYVYRLGPDGSVTRSNSGIGYFDLMVGDAAGNLYVRLDLPGIKRIHKVSLDGTVSTLDLAAPDGMWGDHLGNVYVRDNYQLSKLAADGSEPTSLMTGVVAAQPGQDGVVYALSNNDGPYRLYQIHANGQADPIDLGSSDMPIGLTADNALNVYASTGTSTYKLESNGTATRVNLGSPELYTEYYFADKSNRYALGYDENTNANQLYKLDPNGPPTLVEIDPSRGVYEVRVDNAGTLYALTINLVEGDVPWKIYKLDASGTPSLVDLAAGTNTLKLFTDAAGNVYATGFNPDTDTVTVFNLTSPVAGTYRTSVKFPPLRPADDYEARVYLRNEVGDDLTPQLAGSQVLPKVKLKAGPNVFTFDVVVNGNEASYSLASSDNGNSVEDNAITKDDVVTLATGMAKNQPGVDRVEVYLDGACYGSPEHPALLGVLDNAASWNTFTWDTTQALTGLTPTLKDATLFDPTHFDGIKPEKTDADQFPYAAGAITVVSYNDRDERVGVAKFDLRVYAKPEVTLRLK